MEQAQAMSLKELKEVGKAYDVTDSKKSRIIEELQAVGAITANDPEEGLGDGVTEQEGQPVEPMDRTERWEVVFSVPKLMNGVGAVEANSTAVIHDIDVAESVKLSAHLTEFRRFVTENGEEYLAESYVIEDGKWFQAEEAEEEDDG